MKFLKNKSVWLERKRLLLALVLLTGGLLITFIVCLLLKTKVETDAKTEFGLMCTELNNKISARLHTHAQLLRSGAAFFENSDTITQSKWQNFSASQMVERNSQGIHGAGYLAIITPNQLASHEKEMQSEGFRQYSVRPAGKREIYTPVIYIEPSSDGNLRSFGYDMFSDPVCRKSMEIARDINTVALSRKITTGKTNEDIHADAFMCAPVYRKGMPYENVRERRLAIQGWVFITYQMNDLMKGIFEEYHRMNYLMRDVFEDYQSLIKKNIRLEIFDKFSFNQNALLYDNKQVIDKNAMVTPLFSMDYSIYFKETLWYSRFTQYDSITAELDYSKVWFTAAGGTSVSILLFVLYLMLINTNIRAHELAEELTRDLSESEQKYRTLADSGQALIWAAGTDKLCYHFNRVWLEFTGRTLKQEIDNGWTEGVYPEDLQRCLDVYVTAFDRHDKFSMDYRLKRHDGQYRWIEDNGSPSYNSTGEFIGYIGHCIDITDRKHAEDALRMSISRFEFAMNAADMAWWELEMPAGRVLFGNRKAEMLGFPPDKFKYYKDFTDLVHPDDYDYMMVAMRGHLNGKFDKYETEYRILTESNDYKWFYDVGSVVKSGSNSKQIKIAGIVLDITERKTAQLALVKLNEDLQESKLLAEEALADGNVLVEELTKTKEKLEKINSEKDKLFSIIAHDLRSPFQGFIGITEIFAESIDDFSQSEISGMSKEMNEEAKKLFRLLGNLLDWARMQQGVISFDPIEIVLSEIVSQNIDIITKRGKQKGIEIIYETDQNQTVFADEAMLNTILRNLLSNAVKFTRQGGKVSVSSKETENNMVELSVTDSGIGMPEDLSEKLFNMAEKVGRRGTDDESSTGLGLLLCKEFVEKNGGRIRVESQENIGSTFYFTLPAINGNSLPVTD